MNAKEIAEVLAKMDDCKHEGFNVVRVMCRDCVAAALIAYGNERIEVIARLAENNGWHADCRAIRAMKEKPDRLELVRNREKEE